MKKRERVNVFDLMERMAEAFIHSRFMTALVARLESGMARLKPRYVRWVVRIALLVGIFGELWLLEKPFSSGDQVRSYAAIRPVVTQGAGHFSPGPSFRQGWDGLMKDSVLKRRWDSLVAVRPGLGDTLKKLEKMDSAVWMR